MRGFRLNGWQRIGIVLSVLWAIGAGVYLWLGWQTVSYGYWRAYYQCVFTPGNDENSCQSAQEEAQKKPSGDVALGLGSHPLGVAPRLHRRVDSPLDQTRFPDPDLENPLPPFGDKRAQLSLPKEKPERKSY
jgi:hypothetical protein